MFSKSTQTEHTAAGQSTKLRTARRTARRVPSPPCRTMAKRQCLAGRVRARDGEVGHCSRLLALFERIIAFIEPASTPARFCSWIVVSSPWFSLPHVPPRAHAHLVINTWHWGTNKCCRHLRRLARPNGIYGMRYAV